MLEELDRAIGRALVFQARATGNLGKVDEAIALATKSCETIRHGGVRAGSGQMARTLARP